MISDIDTAKKLKQYIDKIENLEATKKEIQQEISESYSEIKATGFDVKTVKQLIKIRKMDKEQLEEQEYLLDVYKNAINMALGYDNNIEAQNDNQEKQYS